MPVSHKIDASRYFCTLYVLRTSFVVKFTISSGLYHKKLLNNTLSGQANSTLYIIPQKRFFNFVSNNTFIDFRVLN